MLQELVYRDGNLVSGSLDALVQHMVPTEEYYPDRAYLFAFLLSARLFIKPHELLGEVCALCEHQQNLNGEGGKVSRCCLLHPSFFLSPHIHTHPTISSPYGISSCKISRPGILCARVRCSGDSMLFFFSSSSFPLRRQHSAPARRDWFRCYTRGDASFVLWIERSIYIVISILYAFSILNPDTWRSWKKNRFRISIFDPDVSGYLIL